MMKFLVLGINPSGKNKELSEDFDENENFNTNSASDKKLKGAFEKRGFIRNIDYKVTDIIRVKMRNNEFRNKSPEYKLKLAEENVPRIIKKVEDFEEEFVLLLTTGNKWFKNFQDFLNSLEKQIKIPIIRIKHPRYVSSYKKYFMSPEEYAEHIKSRIRKGCDGR